MVTIVHIVTFALYGFAIGFVLLMTLDAERELRRLKRERRWQ